MTDYVQYSVDGRVATITMDDGKANALGPDMIAALLAAYDRAEADEKVRAVVLAGRPGRFCAGFDLRVLTSGAQHSRPLVKAGTELFVRNYSFPRPVVAACTGHALAGGALMLLTSDIRIGAAGSFKLGLNEVAIGIPLPTLVRRLAADRLAPTRLTEAILTAHIYDPSGAQAVGYLDEVVDEADVLAAAHARAAKLAQLPPKTFARSKADVRGESIELIKAHADEDLERILAGGSAG